MNKSLTEHVQNIGKQSEELIRAMQLADRLLDEPNADPDDDLRLLARQLIIRSNKSKLLSQLKTIELLKEELEGMKRQICTWNVQGQAEEIYVERDIEHTLALSQAITLLDTIIQDLKSQVK